MRDMENIATLIKEFRKRHSPHSFHSPKQRLGASPKRQRAKLKAELIKEIKIKDKQIAKLVSAIDELIAEFEHEVINHNPQGEKYLENLPFYDAACCAFPDPE